MNNYYRRGGRVDYGIGGALLKLGSNLASGKGFGSGALKGVGKAAVTPGSGIGAGTSLAGNLLQKSKNPLLKGIGKAAGVASNFMPGGGGVGGAIGALAGGGGQGGQGGGGGFLQNAAGMLGGQGGQGGGGGMLQNLAGNLAGQGGGGAGAGLLNMAQGFLGAEQGVMVPRRMQGVKLMKRPMAAGGMVYGDGGMIYADNGVVTPKKKTEDPPTFNLTPEEIEKITGQSEERPPLDLDAAIAASVEMPQASSSPSHAGFGGLSTDVAMPRPLRPALLPPIPTIEKEEEEEEDPTPPDRISTLDPLKPAPIPLDRQPRLLKGERREIPEPEGPKYTFSRIGGYGGTPESGHIKGSGSSGANYDESRAGQPGGLRLATNPGEGPRTGYDMFYLPGATGVATFGDTPTSIRTLPSGREDVTGGDRSIDSAGYKNITDIYDLYGEDAYMTALGELQKAGVDIDQFDLPIDFDRAPRLVGTTPSQGSVLKSRATRSTDGRVVSGTGRLGDPAFTGGTSKMATEGALGAGQRKLQDYFKRMAQIAIEEYGPDSKEAKEAIDLIAQNQSVGGHVMRPRGVRAIKR